MTDINLEEELERAIDNGVARQGQEFTFTRPEGRTAEEGLTLPELVFQAVGAAYAEGRVAGIVDGEDEHDYSNLLNIGHSLLAHVADQVRA